MADPIEDTFLDPQDFHEVHLPVANIARTMKSCLPENSKVSKSAKDLVQLAASEFIVFVTSEANEHVADEKRKTLTCADLVFALNKLGFRSYARLVTASMERMRTLAKIRQMESDEIVHRDRMQRMQATAMDGTLPES